MPHSRCNDRGISLIEVVIATFLTTIGILAIMSMQPTAWQAAYRSDYLGRAAEILAKEMETRQSFIMNSCNTVTTGTTTNTNYLASGQSTAQTGDAQFTVQTSIVSTSASVYRVTVNVSWNGGRNHISDSMIVSRQSFFQSGC